ncbi:DUF397 domain-containing protein [Dactylosporangium sp. NPDC049140]|uniref:DUF397 domain-containing protein n=1 Tax=Dactylosporangium sp. NPDC049140 TaxID=3155647 RepID=UPI00340C4D48
MCPTRGAADLSPTHFAWRRASVCVSEHNCVEVAALDHVVSVRNSTRAGVTLAFTATDWRSFLASVKNGTLAPDRFMGAGRGPTLDGA